MRFWYLFLFIFLTACHPQFPRERAKAYLEFYYRDVVITDYYEYPNCSKAHTYAWEARDSFNEMTSGLLCCDSGGKCLVLEKK